MIATFRPIEATDIPEILAMNLRQEDKEEVRASAGLEPVEALSSSILHSNEVSVILIAGEIVGLFGLAPLPGVSDVAAPWMLATDALFSKEGVRSLFAQQSKEVVEKMFEKYSWLTNYVAVRNRKAVRWLAWLGFSFMEKTVLLDPAVEFVRFEKRR
jgi:hypothetical protein